MYCEHAGDKNLLALDCSQLGLLLLGQDRKSNHHRVLVISKFGRLADQVHEGA